jgi:ribonuclease HII
LAKTAAKEQRLAIVAGIDEAGFGPVLGPLVVSAAAFELPEDQADGSLWKLLAPAVTKRVSHRRAAIAIGDSKELYGGLRGEAGVANLEMGVLAMLRSAGARPRTLKELLGIISPDSSGLVAQYPWYAHADLPLPHAASATTLSLLANALAVAMRKAGVSLRLMRCQVLFEGEYNRIVSATRNKATTLFDTTARLLAELWRRFASGGLRIHADHQGGRINYLFALQRAFEGCQFKVLEQTASLSAYRMADGPRSTEIRFAVKGEKAHLPVALASMASKYLRELLMVLFNRFWAGQVPGVAPTAGYYVDGRRFYREILPAVRRLGFREEMLYRTR